MYQDPFPANPTKAAIVLVHYGDPSITLRCLRSIQAQEALSTLVVVVDHDLEDSISGVIRAAQLALQPVVIRCANRGFGAGCNAGATEALAHGASWLWFLNNDACIDRPLLGDLLHLAQANPTIGLWGTFQKEGDRLIGTDALPDWFPTQSAEHGPQSNQTTGFRLLHARETLSGASIFLSRRTWEALGPWPEWCFLYWEDVAWGLEAHARRIPSAITDFHVIHSRNTTTGKHSPLSTYYGTRNGLLLHSDLWPSRRISRALHGLHLLQKRFFQGNWGMIVPTWNGIIDAAKNIRYAR